MITEPIIQFVGKLSSKENALISRGDLTVEYFDLSLNKWASIIPNAKLVSGKLAAEIDLAKDDFKALDHLTSLYAFIGINQFPLVRLALMKPGIHGLSQVIALGGTVNKKELKDRTQIKVDFGENWLLDPYAIRRAIFGKLPELEYSLIATERPAEDNPLYPAYLAALNETERYGDYLPETHTVFTRPKDDVYEANDTKIKELLTALETLKLDLEKEIALNKTLTSEVATLTRTKAELEKAIIGIKSDIELTKAALVKAEKSNADLTENLASVKEQTRILEDKLSASLLEIETLEAEKEDILNREAKPANEVYSAILNEAEIAATKTRNEGGRFTVANLSLTLKTHVLQDAEGFKLQLIDSARADYVQNDTISDLHIDIISQEPSLAVINNVTMPNVSGLTETAARNRLTALGLTMKTIYQASKTKVIGQAFKQIPVAGSDIIPGDVVTVIFAKNPTDFN